MRRSTALLLASTLLVLCLGSARDASAAITCQYEPTTRVLLVTGGDATLRRVGTQINVFELSGPMVSCGGTPTVTNTDQIDVVARSENDINISLSGGPFAPGATPDPGSTSEIEFKVSGVGNVELRGGSGKDHFRYTTVGGQSGLNLNAGLDDEDVDLLVPDPRTELFVQGGVGPDTIDAIGHPKVHIDARGGPGNDTLIVQGNGFRGRSELLGGDGRDRIIGGPASDWIFPGPGADVINAKGGSDEIDTKPDKQRDSLDCGPGRDTVRRFLSDLLPPGSAVDPFDRLRSCERVERRR